jgi:RimJ/RimL family protein N-acetyltransferase
LYVAEIDTIPLGTVRMDAEALGYELSWTVSPAMRGSGIGSAMVVKLANDISKPIRAEIKKGNIASIRIAESAGMVFEREDGEVLYYRRAALP